MAEQENDSATLDESTIITGEVIDESEMDEKTARSRGKTRLKICTGTITGVGNQCENRYSIGDTLRVPCVAETSCPIRSGRRLIFSDGCWVTADRDKDCHWAWV